MVGTAMPSGHSHTAGAAAGMVWQQLGVLQTFVLRLIPALSMQTWEMFAHSARPRNRGTKVRFPSLEGRREGGKGPGKNPRTGSKTPRAGPAAAVDCSVVIVSSRASPTAVISSGSHTVQAASIQLFPMCQQQMCNRG